MVECPNLPGCISQGASRPEALANIKEAIECYAAALEEDGLPVPETSRRQTSGRSPRLYAREASALTRSTHVCKK